MVTATGTSSGATWCKPLQEANMAKGLVFRKRWLKSEQRYEQVREYTPGWLFQVPKCPRCGGSHEDLPAWGLDPDKRLGALRAGETHAAVCPARGWQVFFVTEWVPSGAPHGWYLRVREVV
jgi:hypothetical protein